MCVFQVRLKPSEVRIPAGNVNYMIVQEEQYARPYGICFKDTISTGKGAAPIICLNEGPRKKNKKARCVIS